MMARQEQVGRPHVAILLSVYNGKRFLEAQISSLLAQNYGNFAILVRDDGSTDGSVEVVKEFGTKDARIKLVKDSQGNVGPARSFFTLLGMARADIYMFCDQDDIWLPDKVSRAVTAICARGVGEAILFHSDLVVVDEAERVIGRSFNEHQSVRLPDGYGFNRLLVQNCVVGCTMAVTETLVERAGVRAEPPTHSAMHDWWLALWCSCFGTFVFDPEPRILYRQHGGNVSGARKGSMLKKVGFQFTRAGMGRIRKYVWKIGKQAEEFLAKYGSDLTPEYARKAQAVSALCASESGLRGVFLCATEGVFLQRAYMNAAIAWTAVGTAIPAMLPFRTRSAAREK